ncbi:unnamed protein product, partial [Medioppia subpectinata]
HRITANSQSSLSRKVPYNDLHHNKIYGCIGIVIIFIIIITLWSSHVSGAYCPATDFFYPCQCISRPSQTYEFTISCCGPHISDMDLLRAFTRLNTYLNGSMSSKTFFKLEIMQTSIQNI